MRIDWRSLWPYAAIFAIALVPRLLFIVQIDYAPFSDEQDYVDCAQNLLAGKGLAMTNGYRAYRDPGYPILLAGIWAIFSDPVWVTRLLQAFVGAFGCVLCALIARRMLGHIGWALAAGLAAAFFDELIFFTGQLLTETIFTVLLLGWLYGLLSVRRTHPGRFWFLAGLALGFITLVRPPALLLAPIPIVMILLEEHAQPLALRRQWILFVLAGLIIAILPWSIRNTLIFGRFVPLTTNTGVNLYIGHNPHFNYLSEGEKQSIRDRTDLDEVEESKYFSRLAVDYALDNPGRTAINTGWKLYYLYVFPMPGAYRTLDGKIHFGPIKPWPWYDQGRTLHFWRDLPVPVLWWGMLMTMLSGTGMLMGLVRWREWYVLLLAVGLHTLPYLIFFANARFRLPVIPLMIVFSLLVWKEVVAMFRRRLGADGKDGINGTESSEDARGLRAS